MPDPMPEPFYVTTPIYYVNDQPHIGHSYTTVAADVLARYHRLAGRDVRFLTGTDEHGIKMCKAADEKGIAPNELADLNAPHFKALWEKLDITNDDFIRTTEPRHENRVSALVQTLVDSGEIYRGSYEGWYDEGQEEYVTETAAKEQDFKSAINAKPLVKYSEDTWFFRLTKFAPRLIEHIEANPTFIQPSSRRNEVLSKLKMGIEDLCISRNKTKLPWGIDMPNDPDHVVYVWIDALSNYINALGIPSIGDDHDGEFAQYWPASIHLIGKDILWFHAVYWPCILMAADLPLPKQIYAHGWWTSEGQKMSKTLGNFISCDQIDEICADYGRDVYKYYLLRAITFGSDGDFNAEQFRQTYNTELANSLGNLLSRTVKMIGKYFDGVVPAPTEEVAEVADVQAAAQAMIDAAPELMDKCAFNKYIQGSIDLVHATNQFIEITAPFTLAKDDTQRERLATIMYTCAEAVRLALVYLQPILTDKVPAALEVLAQGDAPTDFATAGQWGVLQSGTAVGPAQPLFPRKS
jgi:methionyl-tRNA synthetase